MHRIQMNVSSLLLIASYCSYDTVGENKAI